MSVEYTPQALYPSDQDGRDKYLIDELNKISFAIAQNADDKGYGGVVQEARTDPAVTITAGAWYTVPADTAMLDNPLNLLQDEINAGISVLVPGIWRVDISLSCGFDPISNKARYIYLRLYNLTQDIPLNDRTTSITIEKNIEAFNISTSGIFEVPAVTGDLLGLQLGGSSDDLLGFTVDGYKLMATLVAKL